MNGPSKLSAIGRPLDPRYPTNRLVLILLPLVAATVSAWTWLIEQAGVAESLIAGATGALALFGGWALAREIDPDGERYAFVAAALVTGSWLFMGGQLAPLFLAMILARIVNRTTGMSARPTDTAAVFLATLVVMWICANPLLGLAGAFAFGADAYLDRGVARHRYVAVLLLPVAVGFHLTELAVLSGYPAPWTISAMTLATVGILLLLKFDSDRELLAVGDISGTLLSPQRVHAGVFVVLLTAVTATAGDPRQGRLIWVGLAALGVRLLHSITIGSRARVEF